MPGYEATGWLGIGAPKRTAAGIIEKLNGEINAALADPAITARLGTMGIEPTPNTSVEFGKFIAAETDKWAKVIAFAHIKAE